jgi:hypothetical protein
MALSGIQYWSTAYQAGIFLAGGRLSKAYCGGSSNPILATNMGGNTPLNNPEIRRLKMHYDSAEYKTICKRLGFNASMQYIRVTRSGLIEPTAGTREEARKLWRAVKATGLTPSKKFQATAKREGF